MSNPAAADGPSRDAGLTELKGSFIEGGVECPLFRAEDGTKYALQGIDRSLIVIGEAAVLVGSEVQMSICQQGRAFDVQSVTLAQG